MFLGGTRGVGTERTLYEDTDHFDGGYIEKLDIVRIAEEQCQSVEAMLDRHGVSTDLSSHAPILDVGCARGHFLDRLSAGYDRGLFTGLDISSAMVERGRLEFGLDLRAGAVEEVDLPEAHFGLITMFDVFEHVADPRGTLRKLLKSVRPGGVIVLEVPSETTVFRMLARWAFRMTAGRIRGPLEQLYHRAHVSYFTKRSLARLIESAGGQSVVVTTKEAHVTRFGLHRYPLIKRVAIEGVCVVDRILRMQAKLLVALRRPAE